MSQAADVDAVELERVVEMIDDLDADFVVISGRDRSPTRQAMFGSVSQEILRAAPCPAVSVRKTPDWA
ncbi:universal stress protein [Halapricum hydrolyticum]|uniref:Universal stress protein n=1 Tax=Halapricum hydrolyticum TaxID=2979991 RepID=A0AAE3IAM7_9EURY|nr:universal stress protein [Halapricum hydrolyticum]MCU4716822.1 universal stress protein [Halapricum hydrolyticum]MCU4725573.1 universal stress protein [Halapricum hydrolyticum]